MGAKKPSTKLTRKKSRMLRWKWSKYNDQWDQLPPRGVPLGSPEGGETGALSLSLWYFITKITDTGRKPSPGEFVMIIRLGNISGPGTSPLSSPAWQSFTFLTEVEIDQTLAGWCDGVLVLTVTTPLTTSLTLTRLPCSTEPSFLSTCDVTRATRQLSPHQQPHWSSPLQGLQTTLHTPF